MIDRALFGREHSPVVSHAQALQGLAGDERAARRPAQPRVAARTVERHALAGQAVHHGRPDDRVSGRADERAAMLIGEKDEEVRTFRH